MTIYVNNFQLQIANPWIPINANDDNGSNWQANSNGMIPSVRDFNYLEPLPSGRSDPQLIPITFFENGEPSNCNSVMITVGNLGTGRVRFWTDDMKTCQIPTGVFDVAVPDTIYVEGTSVSSFIPDNDNQPIPDIQITITFYTNGGGATLGSATLAVGVGPVVKSMSISPGSITFQNGTNILDGFNSTNTVSWAWVAPMGVAGTPQFVQIEALGNAANGAFQFSGTTPAKNWYFQIAPGQTSEGPVLDMAPNAVPPAPYYPSTNITSPSAFLQNITTFDAPFATASTLTRDRNFKPQQP